MSPSNFKMILCIFQLTRKVFYFLICILFYSHFFFLIPNI